MSTLSSGSRYFRSVVPLFSLAVLTFDSLAFNNPFATTLTTAGAFQCPPGQNHILCQCCMQPMPDRRDEADIYQHCSLENLLLTIFIIIFRFI